nr:major capsid family protein [Pectinatus frisingensis]
MAKIISNPADDLPFVDALAEEWPVSVKELGAAYGYSVGELENAAFANVSLSTLKSDAVKRAIDTKLNKIAWNGDAASNIIGFLDNDNVSIYTLTADGTSSATTLSSKTAEKQYRDVANLIETIAENTEETEDANTVLLAPAPYRAISTTLYTTTDGQTTQTVLQMLKAHYPQITRWIKVGELHNADSTGTKDLMIAGYFDPSYIRFEIPLRFEQRPVQEVNLFFKIPCRSKAVGVTVFRPYCFTKAVGA